MGPGEVVPAAAGLISFRQFLAFVKCDRRGGSSLAAAEPFCYAMTYLGFGEIVPDVTGAVFLPSTVHTFFCNFCHLGTKKMADLLGAVSPQEK